MSRLRWGVVCVAAVGLFGCPPKPSGMCAGVTCSETQRCDLGALLCVDDNPPVVVLNPVAEVVTTPTFTLTGSITDDEAVTSADWHTSAREAAALALEPDGTFSQVVDAPDFDAEDLVLIVTAHDKKVEVSKQLAVRIDRRGPTIALVSPAPDAGVSGPSFDVVLKATDGSGSLGSFIVNGTVVASPTSGAQATTSIAVPDTANHSPVTVTAVATDARGNSSTQTFTFFGDRVAPTVSITSPALNAFVTTATFVVDAVVTEPGPLSSVVFHIGSTDVPGSETGGGHWSATLPAGLVEQDETITVTATDAAGNVGTATRVVKVDRIAPVVTITAPTAGGIFRTGVLVNAQTTGTPSSVSATLEGQTVALTGGPLSWTSSVPVGAHDYAAATLEVRATDAAGNVGVANVSVFVDTVAPVITITAPMPAKKFKIADFATSADVTTTWTVQDGDAQAATTQVNGSNSTATSLARPTSSTDNPTTYTNTITAADRAGNTATATISYSVDRVAPTVTAWTPAANARNVSPRRADVTFSEVVTGGEGLTVVGQAVTGSWSTPPSSFGLSLDAFPNRVLELAVNPALTDLHGNPVVTQANRRAHFATGFAAGSLQTVAINIAQFDVSSDLDGVASIATITNLSSAPRLYEDVGGSFTARDLTGLPSTVTKVAVNSWSVADGTTLLASHRVGMTVFDGTAHHLYLSISDGATRVDYAGATPAAHVSRTALQYEPVGTTVTGLLTGTSYGRASTNVTYTLPSTGMQVAVAGANWSVFGSDATHALATQFYCRRALSIGGQPFCSSTLLTATTTSPTNLQGASSSSCVALTWDSSAARNAFFYAKGTCETDNFGCAGTVPMTPVVSPLADLRVARWDANGEDGLLMSYRVGSTLTLAKTSACGTTGLTTLGSWTVTGARAHAPVRIGNAAGLLYLDASYNLKLQMQ